uniref:Ribosomal protein S13 n=1 Tax=Proteromonas lacertae TaxID=42746 RepID=E2EA07_PROLC|nr:ribosomal protein S13 [Proteromonas lacertae]ADD46362.1 ribosomal protein S13 [Proteromonas lacertae]
MQNEYISLLKKNIKLNINISELLTSIYSINLPKAIGICNKLGFNPNKQLKTIKDIDFILKILSNFLKLVEKNDKIKSKKLHNIETIAYLNNLKNTKNLKYYRLKNGLPVHGQRTHSNGQIAKLKLHFNE